MIFEKNDYINKQSFKSRFSTFYLQRSSDLSFISNNITINDRLLKIKEIVYAKFYVLLWKDTCRRESETSSTIHEKIINAIKDVLTIICMTNVDNKKCKL